MIRDRLIELLREAKEHPEKTCPRWELPTCAGCDYNKGDECDRETRQADFLLENGVIVKPEGGIGELSDFCPHCGAVMDLKTGHSEEEWEKAVENIRILRNEAKQILMGSFYVAHCDRMLREYEQGNRSDELFEEMMNAH